MCGVVGAALGDKDSTEFLLKGLSRLEYRGYDSAGIAVVGDGLWTRKTDGTVDDLPDDLLHGTTGIAHTRWATHGPPTEENAHPHTSCSSTVAVVHNGIIENADLLRSRLEDHGHRFTSETDSEVLAHLIGEALDDGLLSAVREALSYVEGTYGLLVVSSLDPGKIIAARRSSPLVIGIGDDGHYVASDASPLAEKTQRIVYLDDDEIAVLEPDHFEVFRDGAVVDKDETTLDWSPERAQKQGYDHFMLKEIHEQPKSIRDTLRGRIRDGEVVLGGVEQEEPSRVVLIGCGTSLYASMVGASLFREAGIPARAVRASDWVDQPPILEDDTLVVAVSQSGETADTLAALEEAKSQGCKTLGVVNVVASSIARETDGGVYLHAGPEIGVASTKAFTSQITTLGLLSSYLGRHEELLPHLKALPHQVEEALEVSERVEEWLDEFQDTPLYLGRGPEYATALEGALKLKEISYIPAQGYSGAEMKHGPIALIEEGTPAIVIAPRPDLTLGNINEIRSRGAEIFPITTKESPTLSGIRVPLTHPALQPALTVIPLQLLAYHAGVREGHNVDQPRNLAKSVTVQ